MAPRTIGAFALGLIDDLHPEPAAQGGAHGWSAPFFQQRDSLMAPEL
jgi:hypothetical protein